MNKVVNLSDYRSDAAQDSGSAMRAGLIPIEFALGMDDREQCLAKLTQYKLNSIHVRMVENVPGALMFLIEVNEAIWLNKKILEDEEISEMEIEERIDLIQLMENMSFSMLDSLWEPFSSKSGNRLH